MQKRVFVYDPTQKDSQSRVRGIGRYLQVLKEALPDALFSTDLMNASLYDVLINPFFNIINSPLIKKRVAPVQIAVIHDLIPLKYPDHFPLGARGKLNVFLNKRSLNIYDTFVTDSEASKKDIMSILNVSPEKIRVVYPALPQLFFEKTKNALPAFITTERFCLYVGDATWNKNLVALAQAILLADVRCVFAGNVFKNHGSLSNPWQLELKKFLEIAKDDPHFIFPGFISDEELLALYQNTICNVLLSRDEGFGYSFFEAATQGAPSVLSDIPVFRETAKDAAVFTNFSDSETIADAITSLKNEKLRAKIVRKAKEEVKKVSPEVFRESLSSLF